MSDLILPTDEQVERAKEALLKAHGTPWYESEGDVNRILILMLNKDAILGSPVTESFIAQQLEPQRDLLGRVAPKEHEFCGDVCKCGAFAESPIALTEDHVASLERAIRAEGYNIRVDTETGEVKLYKVTSDGSAV